MTITINQISSGMALNIDGNIYLITSYHHVKPGKGSAFARVKLKNLQNDAVIDRTFKTSDKLDDVPLEDRPLEYLYSTGSDYHFMDHSTFEEVVVSPETLGDTALFMPENLEVTGIFHNHRLLKIILPTFISVPVSHADPGLRGDSSKAGTKPAKIETGATVQVPLFVNTGDWIKIDTRSGEYVERVQK